MSESPPAVPLRTASIMSRWANTNLAPNSHGQVSLPQGSHISQAVTSVTRSGSEYPPLPPETRPHRPPRQRAIVTATDARLVTSSVDGAQTQVAVVAPSLTKPDDGQVSIQQLGDTEPTEFEQQPTDAVKVPIPSQVTQLQSIEFGLPSQKSPYKNSDAVDQGIQTKVKTCCTGVQTDVELQTQQDSNDARGIGQGVQTNVHTRCAEAQTEFDMRLPSADVMTATATEITSTEHTLSDDDSSVATSVGGGQVTSQIPCPSRASQNSGSTVSARPIESPSSHDSSSEFSVDSTGENLQPGRQEIHHHHYHHHHTHIYRFCTVNQHNTNLTGGHINEVEEQYEDD